MAGDCVECPYECDTCDPDGCLTCASNRIDAPTCSCPDGYSDEGEKECVETVVEEEETVEEETEVEVDTESEEEVETTTSSKGRRRFISVKTQK